MSEYQHADLESGTTATGASAHHDAGRFMAGRFMLERVSGRTRILPGPGPKGSRAHLGARSRRGRFLP